MSKQQKLFDTKDLIQRPVPDQKKFEEVFHELLNSLPAKMDSSLELTIAARSIKKPISINRLWFANEMNGNILAAIAETHPHFIKETGRGNHCLYMQYKYECYIKKLNYKLFPQYNHTDTSEELCNQMAKQNEEPLPIIFFGYTANKTKDKITGYYAVCIKGEERLWVSDLTCIPIPQIMNQTNESEIDDQEPLVKPKKKRDAK